MKLGEDLVTGTSDHYKTSMLHEMLLHRGLTPYSFKLKIKDASRFVWKQSSFNISLHCLIFIITINYVMYNVISCPIFDMLYLICIRLSIVLKMI